ncbi:MAG: fatty acid desaturase [Acidimicrobiales bacterium]
MTTTMVPDVAVRPSVLPTERLLANGMCRPEIRRDLRRIDDFRNVLTVIGLWAWVVAMVVVSVWIGNPFVFVAVFVLMGPVHARFAILMHEAAHKLLFTNKKVNDWVGTWVISYPALVPIQIYRRGHFAHHRQEFGPDEPDLAFYGGYPCDRRTLARRLGRDAIGISGWKNLKPLLRSVKVPAYRAVSLPIVIMQAGLWALAWVATGRWWIYPLLWLAPWMTQWKALNRLRAIAEHGGMEASDDRRMTTHNVRQSPAARFWIVPYNTGWHLAHHVDMGIPFRNLPKFHAELERAGYITSGITYPSYLSLWKELASA